MVTEDDQPGRLALARAYALSGKRESVVALIANIDAQKLGTVDQVESLYQLRREYQSTQDAEEMLRRVIDESQAEKASLVPWARRQLALEVATAGDGDAFDRAVALIQANLAVATRSIEDRRAMAVVHAICRGNSEPNVALAKFQTLQDEGWSPSIGDQFLIGQLHVAAGDWSKGRKLMLTLMGDDQNRQPPQVRSYAKLLLEHGDVGDAELWLVGLRDAGDSSVETAELLAEVRFRREQFDELLTALSVEPDALAAKTDLETRWFATTVSYQERYRMLSRFAETLRQGKRTEIANRFEQVSDQMAKKLEDSDQFPGVFYATQLLKRGRCSQAVKVFQQAYQDATVQDLVVFSEVVLQADDCVADELAKLDGTFRSLIDSRDEEGQFSIILARLKEAQGDFDKAMEVYEGILRNDATHAVAKNNLATLLALTGRDPIRGIELCNEVIAQEGESMVWLDTLGVCQLQAGNLVAASENFSRAMVLYPHPIIRFHLAWTA